jgi:hypothetical protein
MAVSESRFLGYLTNTLGGGKHNFESSDSIATARAPTTRPLNFELRPHKPAPLTGDVLVAVADRTQQQWILTAIPAAFKCRLRLRRR